MLRRKDTTRVDRRDEIVLGIVAFLIPLTTLPALFGL